MPFCATSNRARHINRYKRFSDARAAHQRHHAPCWHNIGDNPRLCSHTAYTVNPGLLEGFLPHLVAWFWGLWVLTDGGCILRWVFVWGVGISLWILLHCM